MMPLDAPTPTLLKIRTEDGCDVTLPSDRVINTAKRWSPHRVFKEQVSHLSPGDMLETARGWSSIVEVANV